MKKYLLAALFLVSANANATLITNGGFESGDFSGWSRNFIGVTNVVQNIVHSGNNAMQGSSNFFPATLSQTFATTIGTTYDLEFWSKNNDNTNNTLNYSISGSGPITVAPTGNWLLTQLSFDAISTSTALEFSYETSIGSGSWYIDDVAVTSAVPVPAALFMFAPALLGLLGFRHKARA